MNGVLQIVGKSQVGLMTLCRLEVLQDGLQFCLM